MRESFGILCYETTSPKDDPGHHEEKGGRYDCGRETCILTDKYLLEINGSRRKLPLIILNLTVDHITSRLCKTTSASRIDTEAGIQGYIRTSTRESTRWNIESNSIHAIVNRSIQQNSFPAITKVTITIPVNPA